MNNTANSSEPIYQMVTNTLKKNIIDGHYLPGHILPSVNNLCEIYSASRMTIHKSLKALEAEGYIFSHPGKGYFVSSPQYNHYDLNFFDDENNSVLHRINVITAPDDVASVFGLTSDDMVIKVIRMISHKNTSVACDIRYYPYVKGIPTIESEIDFAVFPELAAAKASPFAFHTHMEISAESAAGQITDNLNCAEGDPLLVVRRTLYDAQNQCIGYSIKYMKSSYGPLSAESGLALNP